MTRRNIIRIALIAVVAIGIIVAGVVYQNFFKKVDDHYETVEELFKYGPSGAEEPAGVPYHIWKVLPEAFPDLLAWFAPHEGDDWRAFGLYYEKDRDLPVGISVKTVGFKRVATNCAFCHVSRYKMPGDEYVSEVYSGTRADFNGQAYFRFLIACGNDSRFNADHLMPLIDKKFPDMPAVLRLAYPRMILPATRDALRAMYLRLAWWYEVPSVGPGRWIAFNDLKYHFANQPIDGGLGNPDVPTLWNLAGREKAGMFHWDGLSDSVDKIIQNACVGGGAEADTIPRAEMIRLRDWWLEMKPPKYPGSIDQELVKRGQPIFAKHCGSCHDQSADPTIPITPIKEIGTDRHRFDMMTPNTVDAYNKFCREYYGWPEDWQIRKEPGYAAVPLDGIWLRAPYLHNGAVPTLADLLLPPAERPVAFYRGRVAYDDKRLGFVSTDKDGKPAPIPAAAAPADFGPSDRSGLFLYDTRLPGNGNGGHVYGTDLSTEDKAALLEYLKTL